MDKQTVAISDAESQVMEVLWHGGSMTADEVVAALAHSKDWHEATVKSLLNRLLKKGAIAAAKDGRRYQYSAVLTRERWVDTHSTGMLERLFGGRIAPLVAHFGKHRKLDPADLAELKRLIDQLAAESEYFHSPTDSNAGRA